MLFLPDRNFDIFSNLFKLFANRRPTYASQWLKVFQLSGRKRYTHSLPWYFRSFAQAAVIAEWDGVGRLVAGVTTVVIHLGSLLRGTWVGRFTTSIQITEIPVLLHDSCCRRRHLTWSITVAPDSSTDLSVSAEIDTSVPDQTLLRGPRYQIRFQPSRNLRRTRPENRHLTLSQDLSDNHPGSWWMEYVRNFRNPRP